MGLQQTGVGDAWLRHAVGQRVLHGCAALAVAIALFATAAGSAGARVTPPRIAPPADAPQTLDGSSLNALVTADDSASDLASAMSSQAGLVTGASWPELDGETSNPASPVAVGTATGFVGRYMPDSGPSFAALTTGDVAIADPPNDQGSAGADDGTSSRNVNDLSILKLDVNVPSSDNCLSFDAVFYSEEYPEYVGSQYNDAFIAELDNDNWTYDTNTNTVSAPSNFAFDENSNLLSVNSVRFTDEQDTLLQYDGSTRLLTAATQVSPGAHSLYLSIYDAGDHIFDSAAFLDGLHTFHAANGQCASGATLTDSDGDGLPDRWETDGIDGNGDGDVADPQDANLPAMGASAQHKDVFVQMDAMPKLRLSNAATDAVEAAFDRAPVDNPDGTQGIHLHIDNGSGSTMRSGATWGSLSQATSVAFANPFGSFNGPDYNWSALDTVKSANLTPARLRSFHYAISIARYGSAANGSSGISRIDTSSLQAASQGGSDFIVSLGNSGFCSPEATCVGPVAGQQGTFMHEFGHNLGLLHGGRNFSNYKANYLSIMNYAFQLSGLVGAPNALDYSRYDSGDIDDIDEAGLAELGGLVAPGSPLQTITTTWPCPGSGFGTHALGAPIDWNCDGAFDLNLISADVNHDGGISTLSTYNDWDSLKFKGGAVGGFGLEGLLPATTNGSDEPPAQVLQQSADALVPPPEATTGGTAGVGSTTATVNGSANPHGSATHVVVQYGTDDAYGATAGPVDAGAGISPVPVTVPLSGLSAATTYHYRVVAQTDVRFVYGADRTFTTARAAGGTCPAGARLVRSRCVRVHRTSCVVPRLKGRGLRAAKHALKRAHCRLGRVTRPLKASRQAHLVVKRQSPKAGTRKRAGTRVRVVLGTRHHGRHHRRR